MLLKSGEVFHVCVDKQKLVQSPKIVQAVCLQFALHWIMGLKYAKTFKVLEYALGVASKATLPKPAKSLVNKLKLSLSNKL